MKARSREIFTVVQFEAPAPEDALHLSNAARRFYEAKYNVRLLGPSDEPRWTFGLQSDPHRGPIKPGDYIITGENGTRVIDERFFDEHYEVLEE